MEEKMSSQIEERLKALTETTIGLTKALATIIPTFYSFKAIQDTLNMALFETNNEAREKAIEYLKSLSEERNSKHKIAEETAIKEIESTLDYLSKLQILTPEERRKRFHLISNKDKIH
jgi:hypothetical protein